MPNLSASLTHRPQGHIRMEDFLSREIVHLSPESISSLEDLATHHRGRIGMTVVADSGFFFLKERKRRRGREGL